MGDAPPCADGSPALSGNELVRKTGGSGMKIADSIKRAYVTWIWKHTPNCAEMSRLASQSLDAPLPLRIWLKMKLHYVICIRCKRYMKHLKFLHVAAPQLDEHAHLLSNRTLSVAAKQRIVQRLQTG